MRKRIPAAISVLLVVCSVVRASSEEAAGGSGAESNIFNGSWADALWTVIAFGALMVVLGKFAWKPLLSALKEREDHIHKQITDAETTRRSAEKMLDDHKQQGHDLLNRVTEQAQKMERDIIEKAKGEATIMKQKAQSDIEHARTAAAQQLWEQAGDMVLSVSTEVLGRTVSAADNQRLMNETIERLRQEENGRRK
jgi:F-type H+-transporting ATPase subunit b